MESVHPSSVKDLDSKKRSFDEAGHQQCQGTTRLRSLSLDSKKRSFDGVGHQQCQGRNVFAVYFWTPRNEALMEPVINNVNDVTSSQFTSGLQETKLLMESVISSVKDDTSSQFISGHQETEALMESVISSVMDETSSQFISGLQETKL